MANANGRNGSRAALIAGIAAIIVGLSGNTVVYLDGRASRTDLRAGRAERIYREQQFFRSQCQRDHVRDQVIILALQDAIHRAQASIPDRNARERETRIIQSRIDTIEAFKEDCEASIPDTD